MYLIGFCDLFVKNNYQFFDINLHDFVSKKILKIVNQNTISIAFSPRIHPDILSFLNSIVSEKKIDPHRIEFLLSNNLYTPVSVTEWFGSHSTNNQQIKDVENVIDKIQKIKQIKKSALIFFEQKNDDIMSYKYINFQNCLTVWRDNPSKNLMFVF